MTDYLRMVSVYREPRADGALSEAFAWAVEGRFLSNWGLMRRRKAAEKRLKEVLMEESTGEN